ncbi:hypothetical protein ACFWD7_49460, partial [Streptomyces mirabilis]|uniref:hypothetical protein n=1 Tax=Streptomyces mirabilis TaxID=68239 RepID=UPI0036909E6B
SGGKPLPSRPFSRVVRAMSPHCVIYLSAGVSSEGALPPTMWWIAVRHSVRTLEDLQIERLHDAVELARALLGESTDRQLQ